MPTVNEVLRRSLYLSDFDGAPIEGATLSNFTGSATALTDGATAGVTFAELSGGFYTYAFTPTTVDAWDFLAHYDDGTVERGPFTETYEITAAATDPFTSSVSGYASGTVGASIAKINGINATPISVTNPVAVDQSVTLVQGDAYEGDDALSWADNGWNIPADATITLSATYAGQTVTFTGVRISATVASVDLSADDTAALVAGRLLYRYKVKADDDVLVTGGMTVRAS